MKFEFSRQILKKYTNTKFHENPSSRSWGIHADGGRIDMTKLIVAFVNIAKAPKICILQHLYFILHKPYNLHFYI